MGSRDKRIRMFRGQPAWCTQQRTRGPVSNKAVVPHRHLRLSLSSTSTHVFFHSHIHIHSPLNWKKVLLLMILQIKKVGLRELEYVAQAHVNTLLVFFSGVFPQLCHGSPWLYSNFFSHPTLLGSILPYFILTVLHEHPPGETIYQYVGNMEVSLREW